MRSRPFEPRGGLLERSFEGPGKTLRGRLNEADSGARESWQPPKNGTRRELEARGVSLGVPVILEGFSTRAIGFSNHKLVHAPGRSTGAGRSTRGESRRHASRKSAADRLGKGVAQQDFFWPSSYHYCRDHRLVPFRGSRLFFRAADAPRLSERRRHFFEPSSRRNP